MRVPRLKSIHLLGVALVIGGAVAALGQLRRDPEPISALPTPAPPSKAGQPSAPGIDHATPHGAPQNLPPGHPNVGAGQVAPGPVAPGNGASPAGGGGPAGATLIEGEVLEVTNVTGYTYARVGGKGAKASEGTWVAVPTAKLAVGDKARVRGEMAMKDFASKQLGKTFAAIWFGTLDDGSAAPSAAPPGGAAPGLGGDPHAGVAPAASAPVVVKVERLADGKTVEEILAQRKELGGKPVKLRAVAVKVTAGVMGKTYLHVRDGSGDATKGTHDLVVTTQALPKIGETLVLEGVLGLDRDIGAGYQFPTILEDAKVSTL